MEESCVVHAKEQGSCSMSDGQFIFLLLVVKIESQNSPFLEHLTNQSQ